MWQKIKQEIAIWRVGAMPGLAIIGLVVLARLTGHLQFLELAALDNFLRWRPQENIDERILIVGIDENDINNLASYPISDRELANLIQNLEQDNPAVIGVDLIRDKPQEPGYTELEQIFRQYNNIIGIEKVLSAGQDSRIYKIEPPPALSEEQIGFVDAILDRDGNLRRSLLSVVKNNELKFSLSIKLAENYLKTQGYSLDNVTEDPKTMQFNGIKLTRFMTNSGGYINADAGGNQILLNFRSSQKPFRIVSLEDIKTGKVNKDWITGNIVLIGVTALSAKDVLNAPGIQADNPGLVYGVEIQAHAISQIISAVLDQRPLLTVWSEGWEYVWILAWGLLGISLARLFSQSPWKLLVITIINSIFAITICYLLLLIQGLWLPVVPAGLVLWINGLGLTASLFYRDRQNLKFKLKDRQYIIKYMSSTIHNRPIQTLKQILRNIQEEDLDSAVLVERLKILNKELRDVGKLVEKETIVDGNSIYVGDTEIDLQSPFKEILYQVYSNTIRQKLPGFLGLKFKIVKFENINDSNLTIEQKRSLCRFLEEALINVGKYAKDATRLKVICTQEQEQNIIRVEDNGIGINLLSNEPRKAGGGTKQAQDLAKQLRGNFRRYPREPKGTICELTWSANKSWFWHF
ncbi:MAG: CHASE2 domain-containing protein [Xenococcaceae cyanobacterium]